MFRRFSTDFALAAMLLDGLLAVACLAIASYLRPLFGLAAVSRAAAAADIPLLMYPAAGAVWVLSLALLSAYDPRRHMRWLNELGMLCLAAGIAAVLLAGLLYLSYRNVSRYLFVFFILLTFLALVAWRGAFRLTIGSPIFRVPTTRRVLIVGRGIVGDEMCRRVIENRRLGLVMVGFLDDDEKKRAAHGDVLGPLDMLREVVAAREVSDVVLALPRRAYERVNQMVVELHDLPVKVWLIPDYFSLALHQAVVDDFAGLPMLDLRAPALSDYQRMGKRVFDVAVTLLMLPVVVVLGAIIAVAVRLDSPGQALFRQKRVGENGRLFEMLKFRTMVAGAEDLRHTVEQTGAGGELLHKAYDDPRVTRLGRFLRRTSLDELPQFLNVLRGEMSLVGPRPELPYLVERYAPWQRKRFAVPQGLTGWWQVHGRSDKPMHLHTEDDLYYVQNYSLWLDVRILFMTLGAVVSRKGAY
jgi:exopolysaccharide biosynthesis polyprenyl glycosylphosphotransferase